MEIAKTLQELKEARRPYILTIGNFDGVHLGHRYLLQRGRELAQKELLPFAVLTFENHPSTILRPNHPALLLTSPRQKLKLLEEQGVDLTLLLPFTRSLSEMTAREFLTTVHKALPFRALLLGYDAKLGNDRLSQGEELIEVAKNLRAQAEFLPPFVVEGAPVSSSRIRKAIEEGDLDLAKKLLGRRYSAFCTDLNTQSLALPPYGVYAAKIDPFGPAVVEVEPHSAKLCAILVDGSHLPNGSFEVEFYELVRPYAPMTEEKKRVQRAIDIELVKRALL